MSRPRFIAGAICPRCGAMDRLQLAQVEGDQRRRCVACGHEDSLPSASSQAPKTRVSGGSVKAAADMAPAMPVRILDPGSADDDR